MVIEWKGAKVRRQSVRGDFDLMGSLPRLLRSSQTPTCVPRLRLSYNGVCMFGSFNLHHRRFEASFANRWEWDRTRLLASLEGINKEVR